MIFYESSAKTSFNVIDSFTELAKKAVIIQEEQMSKQNLGTNGIIRPQMSPRRGKKEKNKKGLKLGGKDKKKKKKCCK